jgi:hypothetical protein
MKRRGYPSPMQLAGWAGFGCLVWISAILPSTVRTLNLPSEKPMFSASDWAALVGAILGFVICFLSDRRLRRGVKDNSWTKDELEPLRMRLDGPWISVLGWLSIGALAVSIFGHKAT